MAEKNDVSQKTEAKPAPILIQMGIFAAVLFISSLISPLFPVSFPVPTPVIGLVLLYLLLTLHIVKVEWVEQFANLMISLIAFLFVPSGIQLTASLNIMKAQGIQLVAVIVISTVILLVVVSLVTTFFIKIKKDVFHSNVDIDE
ncbi:CidA/LrgA family protein [Lentilactobacillus laojiaonis]|uniref:CidA/LrgA family protein n=1 Tax=Lentilactobacillus laojiaonis TaxID=2883998 RepID=UPI001D0B849E|nr:CidA/LrgA family protein [Lentilactobacillus laojiaonis]UDM31839.1 CidA/LrgA family protein [Lentilactobacillus laojiaonis]